MTLNDVVTLARAIFAVAELSVSFRILGVLCGTLKAQSQTTKHLQFCANISKMCF